MTPFTEKLTVAITSLLCSMVTGCAGNLGVAEEMLEPVHPEEYRFSTAPEKVWRVATSIVDSRVKQFGGRVLVREPDSRIISWTERLGAGSKGREDVSGGNKEKKSNPLYENEILEVGEGGVAFTTVVVLPRDRGTFLRIRRVYYGKLTQPRMVHSRGGFAGQFQGLIREKLVRSVDSNVL